MKAYGNPGVGRATGAPGDSDGPGFGWRDQTVYRVGVAYDATRDLTLRVGYNDANQLLDSRDGYKMCEVLLDLGLCHSKIAYPSPEQIKDTAFSR